MNSREYLDTVMSLAREGFTLVRTGEDEITAENEYACGAVRIYHLEEDIVEMQLIRRSDDTNVFFLHFELKDDEHARELAEEFIDCLMKQKDSRRTRILLSCTSGFTTSFFAEKLSEAAKTLALEYDFDAVSYPLLHTKGFDYDVILLAPQIGYQLKKVSEVFASKTVMTIPAQVFASYNTGEMIRLIGVELEKAKQTAETKAAARVLRDIENNACIFIINMTHDPKESRYICRLYDKGEIVYERNLIKNKHYARDLTDILDTSFRNLQKKYKVDCVSISIPNRLILHGSLQKIDYAGMSDYLSSQYGLPVIVESNTNAVAYGFYASQDKYDTVVYHSQPRGSLGGGQGTVFRGHPLDGAHRMAGEIGVLAKKLLGEGNKDECAPIEQIKDTLITWLLVSIASVDPDVILIRSDLTPDMEELRTELKKYVLDEEMPELIHIRDVREYAALGTMLYGLHMLRRRAREKVHQSMQ